MVGYYLIIISLFDKVACSRIDDHVEAPCPEGNDDAGMFVSVAGT